MFSGGRSQKVISGKDLLDRVHFSSVCEETTFLNGSFSDTSIMSVVMSAVCYIADQNIHLKTQESATFQKP
jgi:hypothetical protein